MKPDKTLFWITTIFGMLITLVVIYATVMIIIWEFKEGSGHIMKDLSNIFRFDLNNSILLYLIYLLGYAIAWRKSLMGSIIIITVSITGYLFGYSDERMSYVLIFLVGLFYLAYWFDSRKKKKSDSKKTY